MLTQVRISLVEALPHVLRSFDPALITYTEQMMAARSDVVSLRLNTAVTSVRKQDFTVKYKVPDPARQPAEAAADADAAGEGGGAGMVSVMEDVPYGLLVWVAGIATRGFTRQLIAQIGAEGGQTNRRALTVGSHLQVIGAEAAHLWALGDCAAVAGCGPTAQAAAQQGKYLGWLLNEMADAVHADALAHEAADGDAAAAAEVQRQAAVSALDDFQFKSRGKMAYLGASDAVIQAWARQDRPPHTHMHPRTRVHVHIHATTGGSESAEPG